MLIWIDVPPELALARRLKAFSAEALREGQAAAGERLAWLDGYLSNYLGLVRGLLQTQAQRVRPHADLVVDGTRGLEEIVARAHEQVLRRLP